MESSNRLHSGLSFQKSSDRETSLLTWYNFTPIVAHITVLPVGRITAPSSSFNKTEVSEKRQQEEYQPLQGSGLDFLAFSPGDLLVNRGTFLQQQHSGHESSSEGPCQSNALMAVLGTPDYNLTDSKQYRGFKEATLQTHRIDIDRGLINKRTGQAHMNTVLRTSDKLVVMCLEPLRLEALARQFSEEQGDWSASGKVMHIIIRFFLPWDTQGNVMRVPHVSYSLQAPHILSDPSSCALRFELLVVKRQDKPMIGTREAFDYEDCKDLFHKHHIRGSPWSPEFGKQQFNNGGPWLHYNYQTATPPLPKDPSQAFTLQQIQFRTRHRLWY
ncbi:hypothetical protein E8E14_003252 [Neopestalotiopsis sp. 37M]|nr:hypothetical protein E8E14_003252 [Neopestalotiopsis sp. 37M]